MVLKNISHNCCASTVLTKFWLFFWIVLGEFKEQLLCKESTRTNIQILCDNVKCFQEIEESWIYILEDEFCWYKVIIWLLHNKCYLPGRRSVWGKLCQRSCTLHEDWLRVVNNLFIFICWFACFCFTANCRGKKFSEQGPYHKLLDLLECIL